MQSMSEGAKVVLRELMQSEFDASPRPGKMITIYAGKHKGKSGKVFWHGRNRFDRSRRYMNWAEDGLSTARGTLGFRIGVETDDGARFFTKAEYTIPPCPKCCRWNGRSCGCATGEEVRA